MTNEIQVRSTSIPQNITYTLRNKLSPYLAVTTRLNNNYRGNYIPADEKISPYFISESLCLVLPKYMSATKIEKTYTALAENYTTKILQYFVNLCEEKLEAKNIDITDIQQMEAQFAKVLSTRRRRIYTLTSDTSRMHQDIVQRLLPDDVKTKSHIFTSSDIQQTPIVLSYTPTVYKETEEPHMIAVESTLTFEVITNFGKTEYIRVPI